MWLDMKTVALIPVRGGSKSIPGKNIKPLASKPLLHWTLSAAAFCDSINEVYVSSDSDEIRACALAFEHPKVRVVERAPELATDVASTEAVMLEFAARATFDRLVLIQATSPLTTTLDLQQAIEHLDRVGADSLVTVTKEHRFRWQPTDGAFVTPTNYDPQKRPRRQDWPGELVENGAFYICSREGLLASQCRLNGRVTYWQMSPKTAVEIDTPDDWAILEAIMRASPRAS